MKLSVIIPVYNAAAYLEKCIGSVQAVPVDKEIILIDDGSKDASGEICDRMAEVYTTVKVIHQENQGVSAARNRGLEIADGDMVWFVDADDYVVAAPKISSLQPKVSDSKLLLLPFVWDEGGLVKEYLAYADEVPYNLWRCWFDRQEIERQTLRFTVGRKYAEDQEFILKFLLGCHNPQKSKTAVETPTYYYTVRPGSAMTRKDVKGKMARDISSVLFGFFCRALFSKAIFQGWTWREMKRMAKTLYVTICRT